MPQLLAVGSQKGGVGKSAEARSIAATYAAAGWDVIIYDLDLSQSTTYVWNQRRIERGITPAITVETVATFERALRLAQASDYDLAIFDGKPFASEETAAMAQAVDLMILPTGTGLDDMEPTVLLANSLVENHGVPVDRIAIALSRIGDSDLEQVEARAYLRQTPYQILAGSLREMTAYRRAHDHGRAACETHYPGPREAAEKHMQAIVDAFTAATKTA